MKSLIMAIWDLVEELYSTEPFLLEHLFLFIDAVIIWKGTKEHGKW